MAGKLFLCLSELAGSPASGLTAIWGIGVKEQKQIDTLEDMLKAIGQNTTLDELVIFAHGIPGDSIDRSGRKGRTC